MTPSIRTQSRATETPTDNAHKRMQRIPAKLMPTRRVATAGGAPKLPVTVEMDDLVVDAEGRVICSCAETDWPLGTEADEQKRSRAPVSKGVDRCYLPTGQYWNSRRLASWVATAINEHYRSEVVMAASELQERQERRKAAKGQAYENQ
jgi:hypothetical protein